jgi:hypothetical protein
LDIGGRGFSFLEGEIALLAGCQYLRNLTTLVLHGIDEASRVENLVASPNLRGLRRLIFECGSVDLTGALALLLHQRQLEHLQLSLSSGVSVPLRSALLDYFGHRLVLHGFPEEPEFVRSLARTHSAVCRSPANDIPRLAYADYLSHLAGCSWDEYWSMDSWRPSFPAERAGLIRTQCQLVTLSATDPGRPEAEGWVAELLAAHGEAWRAELPVVPGLTWGRFERGFVTGARVNNLDVLPHLTILQLLAPLETLDLSAIPRTAVWRIDSGNRCCLAGVVLAGTCDVTLGWQSVDQHGRSEDPPLTNCSAGQGPPFFMA